jgi:hypothetical protein
LSLRLSSFKTFRGNELSHPAAWSLLEIDRDPAALPSRFGLRRFTAALRREREARTRPHP